MRLRHIATTIILIATAITTLMAQDPQRAALARAKGKQLTVNEWKTTPDGKKKWIDHAEVYNAKGELIEEAEYSDYGTRLAWRSEYQYNERDKLSKIRTFEYDSNGVCTRRMNYSADGKLNSYRQYQYTFE